MGFLEDLIKTVQEAAEEARAQQRQNKSAPEWTPVPPAQAAPADRQAAHIVRRYREQAEDIPPARQATPIPGATPSTIPPRPRHQMAGADRLGRLLRQHATLRELMLLREILDQPLSLRRTRGRHRRPH